MDELKTGAAAGWKKMAENPVLGGSYGTCFDIGVIKDENRYKMYFSWRPQKSVAYVESADGIHWSEPEICIGPRPTAQGWEDDLNRPAVLKWDGIYHMWYTGQYKPGEADGSSHIFYADSRDGIHFERQGGEPVLCPDCPWEKAAVMCPDVVWDDQAKVYKMWYSGGEQYEPNAIGFATSPDGVHWQKHLGNPVFMADPSNRWEQHKAAGCHVMYVDGWYLMFYIGYHNEHYAQIGIARSRDGITGWQRHPNNPILAPEPGMWDGEACYKPYVVLEDSGWKLWYNGRTGSMEQIGMAVHPAYDLGFDQ